MKSLTNINLNFAFTVRIILLSFFCLIVFACKYETSNSKVDGLSYYTKSDNSQGVGYFMNGNMIIDYDYSDFVDKKEVLYFDDVKFKIPASWKIDTIYFSDGNIVYNTKKQEKIDDFVPRFSLEKIYISGNFDDLFNDYVLSLKAKYQNFKFLHSDTISLASFDKSIHYYYSYINDEDDNIVSCNALYKKGVVYYSFSGAAINNYDYQYLKFSPIYTQIINSAEKIY